MSLLQKLLGCHLFILHQENFLWYSFKTINMTFTKLCLVMNNYCHLQHMNLEFLVNVCLMSDSLFYNFPLFYNFLKEYCENKHFLQSGFFFSVMCCKLHLFLTLKYCAQDIRIPCVLKIKNDIGHGPLHYLVTIPDQRLFYFIQWGADST